MQGNPKQTVHGTQPDPSSLGPLEDSKLVSKGQDFNLQRDPHSKRGEQRREKRCQDKAHGFGRQQAEPLTASILIAMRFLVGTGIKEDGWS